MLTFYLATMLILGETLKISTANITALTVDEKSPVLTGSLQYVRSQI